MSRKRIADVDPIREHEEEHLRDPGFKAQSRVATNIIQAGRAHLIAINRKLAKAHNIPTPAIREHRELLVDLGSIMKQPSAVDLSPEKWSIPSDVDGWKVTREQLATLAWETDELARRIDVAFDSVTFRAAISSVAGEDRYERGVAALYDLVEVFKAAASIEKSTKGKSAGGRRPNPQWVGDFVVAAQRFWVKHMSGGTKPTFLNLASEGANPFTRWIVDVYRELAPPGAINLPMFRTELERSPALRRQVIR